MRAVLKSPLLTLTVAAMTLLAAAADGPSLAELAALPDTKDFKADAYLVAARALQSAGKDKAVALLRELAAREEAEDSWPYTRTLTLCRMLFRARSGEGFRRAAVGAPFLVGATEVKDWPLEPIALVDGVPFLVANGYILGGEAEPPSAYISYCVKSCDWVPDRYERRSAEQKRSALEKLLASPALKGRDRDYDRRFLERQIADE